MELLIFSLLHVLLDLVLHDEEKIMRNFLVSVQQITKSLYEIITFQKFSGLYSLGPAKEKLSIDCRVHCSKILSLLKLYPGRELTLQIKPISSVLSNKDICAPTTPTYLPLAVI